MKRMVMKKYAHSEDIESIWTCWSKTKDPVAWDKLCNVIYEICIGCRHKLGWPLHDYNCVHECFVNIMGKIFDGKMKLKRDKKYSRDSVFNYITSVAFRTAYSLHNRLMSKTKYLMKYARILDARRGDPHIHDANAVKDFVYGHYHIY